MSRISVTKCLLGTNLQGKNVQGTKYPRDHFSRGAIQTFYSLGLVMGTKNARDSKFISYFSFLQFSAIID